MKHKILSFLLLVSFLIAIMLPLTGIAVPKMAFAVFLICCLIHTIQYCKRLNAKKYVILALLTLTFASGIFGMILDKIPLALALHKASLPRYLTRYDYNVRRFKFQKSKKGDYHN